MASSSASSISGTPVPKPSRFSSFRGFKLSRDKGSKPPTPPPKDPYYLKNRSLASLSPDSLSIPPHSPLSPNSQFLRRPSPDMNQSTMSLVSPPISCPPDDPQMPSRLRDKKSAFFRLKRSPKSPLSKKSPLADALPPPPTEDENISLPWNFQVRTAVLVFLYFDLSNTQHNIHVDEGYVLYLGWTVKRPNVILNTTDSEACLLRGQLHSRKQGSHPPKLPTFKAGELGGLALQARHISFRIVQHLRHTPRLLFPLPPF